MEIFGWTIVGIGAVFAILYYDDYGMLAIFGGMLVSATGFLNVAAGQMAMAQIATAENTRAMLDLMQRQAVTRPPADGRVEPPLSDPARAETD